MSENDYWQQQISKTQQRAEEKNRVLIQRPIQDEVGTRPLITGTAGEMDVSAGTHKALYSPPLWEERMREVMEEKLKEQRGKWKTPLPVKEEEKIKADRYNDGKRKWSLVHWKSLEPLVEVLEYGAKKYAPDNWKKGLDKREILDSLMRHVTALMDGQKCDEESKLRHIGHIMCNAMFFSYFEEKDTPKVE